MLAALIVAIVLGAYVMLQRYLAARLRAEVALRNSEESQRTTLQSIGDAVLATDVAGRVTRMNPVAERLTGWTADEATGRAVSEVFRIINEQTRQPARVPVATVLATGAVQGLANHTVLIARDGTERAIADSAAPIRGPDNHVVGVVLVFRDVTEERRVEQAILEMNDTLEQRVLERASQLRESEERFRTTLDNMLEGCQIIGFDWRYLYVNATAAAHGRSAVTALLGRTMMEAFPGIEMTPVFAALRRCMDTRVPQHIESEFVFSDGTRNDFQLVIQPAREGIFVLSLDITDRKRAERERLAAQEDLERRVIERTAELEAAGRELANKNTQLEQANRLKSEFLANMSHELRTPLNAVIGFSEILREGLIGTLTPEQRQFAADIHSSGKHLLSLINDVLDLSKVEAGSMQLESEAVHVATLLESCLAVVREKALARRLDLRTEIDPALDVVEGDSRKLKQIVYNLLSNAVKFTDQGGRVSLAARRVDRARIGAIGATAGRLLVPSAADDEFVELAVEDTGIGIAAGDLDRMFDPFVQVDASLTRRHEGTGLGLALVQRLVELHGGGLAVESEPGLGSRFTVWLPYRVVAEQPSEPPLPPPTARTVPLALVVEDNDASAHLLVRELEGQGMAVIRASTAEEGLVLARKRRPDLITLDVFLPHIDGWECLDRLKSDEETADIPVVIVTVSSEQQRGLALGAVRVLQKPIARQALVDLLTQLGLRGPPPPTILVADDDPAAVEIVAMHLQAAGMNVLRAYGGRGAIDMALTERPALLVLDVMMPEVSGFDVVAALKADPYGKSIPIVVVTAKPLGAEERAQMNGQVLRVVDKSEFSGADFLAEVRRALAAGPREALTTRGGDAR
ncbi:MAG TPA: response regulator [Burkholderiaceae bacterium]|nr:response regulator [Burkholderiaceae bacterium]